VRIVDCHLARDLLAIGDLQRAEIDLDLVDAAEDIDLDVELLLVHHLEDGLAGLLVGRHAERRILGCKLRQRGGEPLLIGFRFRLDRDFYDAAVNLFRHRVPGAGMLGLSGPIPFGSQIPPAACGGTEPVYPPTLYPHR
jgi:hypothetical protein